MKRIISLLLASVLLLGLVCSCNGDIGNGGGGAADNNAIKTDGDYTLPELNMNGETVKVLNVNGISKMKVDFVTPEDSDDTLDIAIYESNMRAQEQFNFRFVEEEFEFLSYDESHIDMANYFIKNVNSGDDIYDFIHYPVNQRTDLITNGYIMDLSELDGLHLDQPWWDQAIINNIEINDRLYMACGAINLNPYEAMTTIFFNKDMLSDYALDDPYEMVRDGSWTIEAMVALGREVQNLNSDPHWGVYEGGTSTYGMARHYHFPSHFLIGAGLSYVEEENGVYTLTKGSDDFYLAAELMRPLFVDPGSGGIAVGGLDSTRDNFYIKMFGEGRTLFLMSELKAGVEMREYEINFGILPVPKLREEQDMYYTDETERLHYVCIPTLSEKPDEVAQILDAMADDRYKNVIPVYYDSYVTYKGLRDEESLEMLEILSKGRTVDVGFAYGWVSKFVMNNLNAAICLNSDLSSLLAAVSNSINKTIDTFVSENMS